MLRIAPWSALAAATLSTAAVAAEPMEPVVVTATRTAQPLYDSLESVEVITREELERLPAGDVADALRLRAGIEVARTGGPGQQTSLFLRGTESNHVLVMVDGVRINPGTIGSAALQNLTPQMIERIEVVKGPRSTLYGSDAIGGVINIVTRQGAATGAAAEVGGGSFATRSAGLAATLAGTSTAASLSAYWLDSEGFPTRDGDDTPRGYRNLTVNGSVRGTAGGVALAARAWHASGTSEYSDFFVTPVDQDFVNSAFSLEAAIEPARNWRSRLLVGHATDDIGQNQSPDFLRTRRWQLDWQNDVAVGEHHELTAGMLLQDEDAESESYGLGFDTHTATRLFYVQDQASLGPHRLLLAAGYTDHDSFGGHLTWNAEYGLALGGASALWLAAGTAFRAPDATDRYGFGGNPALEPESSQSIEVGLRHRVGTGHQLSLVVFRNDIDDLIQYVITDYTTYEGENGNVEQARITGIEAAWEFSGGPWFARAAATLQDPRDLETDTLLLRRARANLTFALARQFGPHEVAVDVLAAGDREDFGFPEPVHLEGYVLANVSARVSLPRSWTLAARLENLLDTQYELARGYNTMDRSLFISLRHDFR